MTNERLETAEEAAQALNQKIFSGRGGDATVKTLEEAVTTLGFATIVAEANGWTPEGMDGMIQRQRDKIRDVFIAEQEGEYPLSGTA
ncbi:MAG: hypothetical protein UW03_C0016G0006 [Candidatus Peregrinibacteria bacterium GW2011_GWA2_43_8]|nr:MAG: hypothetical protein UW03_C0016G0006 [Candidatus Peregrinibacteria bacterium GW2011_GWA2_43_8]